MPTIRRKQLRCQWGDLHRAQLIRGADAAWKRFGQPPGIPCRRRIPEGVDFHPATMHLAEQCWADMREGILASVSDPQTVWAYRRFEHADI